MSLLFEKGANEPHLRHDIAWQNGVQRYLEQMESVIRAFTDVDVPRSVMPVHDDFRKSLGALLNAKELYSAGVANVDTNLMAAGTALVEDSTRFMSSAYEKRRAFCN